MADAPGLELARGYVSIIPSFRGGRSAIARELGGVDRDAERIGQSMGDRMKAGLGRATSNLGDFIGKTLRRGALAGGAAVGAAAFIGLKTAAELENAKIGFETMLGSAEKADKFLRQMRDFAAKTPFELPGLQQSAAQLIAVGIESNKVIPIMTTLGDITAGMGTGSEGIHRAVVAIQQMNAAGRITAEDLNQLRDAGVPVFDLLTAATGKSKEELAGMAQKGKLGREELDKLMSLLESGKGLEKFSGMMDKQSRSLGGLWATLKDTFSVGMAQAIEPAIPALKEGLGGAIKFVADMVPALQDGISWMLENVPAAFETVSSAASDTVGWLKDNAAWLVPLTAGITGYYAAVKTLAIIETVRKLVLGWQAAQWGLNAAVAFFAGVSGIGLVVAGLTALVAGLIWAYNEVGWFRDMVDGAWRGIQNAVGAVVDWWNTSVVPTMTTVFDTIGRAAMFLYEHWIRPAFEFVVSIVRTVGGVFNWLWQNIVSPVLGFIGGAVKAWWMLVSGIFQLAVAFVKNVLGPVFSFLWTNFVSPVFTWIGKKISDFWTGAGYIFNVAVNFLKRTFGPAFTWLRDSIIDPVFGTIGRIISNVWNRTIKPVLDVLMTWIKEKVPDAFEDGAAFIGAAWNLVKEFVKTPIRFVVERVINGGIVKTFNDIAKNIGADVRLPDVAVPPWLQAGNAGNVYRRPDGRARGGIIPGYEPMKRDTVLMGMRPGEGVLVPEVVRALGSGFIDGLNSAGNTGGVSAVRNLAGLAWGGIVPGGIKTSGFGPRAGFNTPGGFHDGVDLAARPGTRVNAADRGNVAFAGWGGMAGNMVRLNHGRGIETLYYHLSSIAVRLGQMVSKGQRIGGVGSTGNSTGPHLHFTVLQNGRAVDPNDHLVGMAGGGDGGFNPFEGMLNFAADRLKDLFPGGGKMIDLAAGLGTKVIRTLGDWVNQKLQEVGDFVGDIGSAVNWSGVATNALFRTGHNPIEVARYLPSLLRRLNQESGGNARAINLWDSNAAAGIPSKGLMQLIDPTFQAYRDPSLPNDIYNPLANITAAIRYTKARYGDLRTGWNRPGGYALGGVVPGLFDNGGWMNPGWHFNGLDTPEPVLAPYQWDIAKEALERVSAGAGDTYILQGIDMDDAEEIAREINFAKKRHTYGGKYAGAR